jgi:enoyl-CoA hydratase/carnithine racemase
MKQFQGQTLSWDVKDGVVELALHREPLNEIGSATLEELEKFVAVLEDLSKEAHALILYSDLKAGFCAGADLRQLYQWIQESREPGGRRGRGPAGGACNGEANREIRPRDNGGRQAIHQADSFGRITPGDRHLL